MTVVMQHDERTVTRWWVSAHQQSQNYDLYVLTYRVVDDVVSGRRAFNGSEWVDVEAGVELPPAMHFTAELMHILGEEWLDRRKVEESLQGLAMNILTALKLGFGLLPTEDSNE